MPYEAKSERKSCEHGMMSQASETNRAGGLEADALARQVEAAGRELGLPYIAATSDIGNPFPMIGGDGRPYAETLFRWIDPELRYWEDRSFALRAQVIQATRICSEPFYYSGGVLASWRRHAGLEAINRDGVSESFGVSAAIIAPAYLPGGLIGAIVWATPEPGFDIETAFRDRAVDLHALALRFIATQSDFASRRVAAPLVLLTRREIQCLKWASIGKTDAEIAEIMAISLPTVRFHMTNAARKLNVVGRPQAIYRAATLGYVGAGPDSGAPRH
jgi:DNA-binding CsgD family transcriptional regulator